MSIKSDRWICDMVKKFGMIKPFYEKQISEVNESKVISYGTSSYGYDVRCTNEFKIFTDKNNYSLIDPKSFNKNNFTSFTGDFCVIPPNSFALSSSYELFNIPRDILVICLGKSTYARCGVIVNITPLEPEWKGHITLELSNTTPFPVKIYANEGIAQIIFFQSDESCSISYADRLGKYQNQTDITLPCA